MLKYIFGRIISLMMILLAVSVIVFTLMHSVPGGPFDERKGRLPPAAKANILKKYGLDSRLETVFELHESCTSFRFRYPFSASSYNRCKTDRKVLGNYCSSWIDDDFCRFHPYPFWNLCSYHQNSWIDTIVL